jgi:hypothetical protein
MSSGFGVKQSLRDMMLTAMFFSGECAEMQLAGALMRVGPIVRRPHVVVYHSENDEKPRGAFCNLSQRVRERLYN